MINFKVFDDEIHHTLLGIFYLYFNLMHQKSWNVSRKWIGNNLDSLRNI